MHFLQFQSSGDLIADRRFEWARESLAQGEFPAAADLLTQVLDIAPDYAGGWFLLGEVRDGLKDRAGAIDAFRRTLAADPQDRHGATMHLMRLGAMDKGGMPKDYVRALFDGYAPRFESALTAGLKYCGPEILRAAVRSHGYDRFDTMLDLGCGTGLAGVAFRPIAALIVGVDLSSGMLAQARAKEIYDRLAAEDAVVFLRQEAEAGVSYQLVLAADVFIYFQDLAPVTEAAARVLTPEGLLAFTVETHDGEGVILRDTLRYAHSPATVRAAITAAGLTLLELEAAEVRTERGVPVPGLVCLARR